MGLAQQRQNALNTMVAWLARSGAKFTKLRVEPAGDDEWTVVANADIAVGERVLTIPSSCVITAERARRSAIGRRMTKSGASLTDAECLLGFVLDARTKRSGFFWPYVNALPQSFPHLAMSFSRAERAELRGTSALQRSAWRREGMREQHTHLAAAIPAFARMSADDVRAVQLALGSRSFKVLIRDMLTAALVPMADMMDHSFDPHVAWSVESESGAFVMDAVRPIIAGDRICDSYGDKSNSQLLVAYGFALADNPHDRAVLQFGLPDDAMRARRLRLIGGTRPPRVWRFLVDSSYASPSTQAVFSFLRIACADGAQLERLSRDDPGRSSAGPLSAANELAVLTMLRAECHRASAAFQPSNGNGAGHPALTGVGRNARNAAIVRDGELRIVRGLLEMCDAAIPVLRMTPDAARRMCDGLARQDAVFGGYLSAILGVVISGGRKFVRSLRAERV